MSTYNYGINYNLFDAIVTVNGGDYQLLSDAITAGAKSIFIKKGTYNESSLITLPDGCHIVGESQLETIINFGNSGSSIGLTTPASARYVTGTIAITNGSSTVNGTGTAFLANVSGGDYIRLGRQVHKILSVTNDTTLVLTRQYWGPSIVSQSTDINTLTTCIIENFTVKELNSTIPMVRFDSCIDSSIRNMYFEQNFLGLVRIKDSYKTTVNNSTFFYGAGNDLLIEDSFSCVVNKCFFINSLGSSGDCCIYMNNTDNSGIFECTFTNSSTAIDGIRLNNCDDAKISGCSMNNIQNRGILVDGSNSNCQITNTSIDGSPQAIEVNGNINNGAVSITNCHIQNATNGIRTDNGQPCVISGCTIHDCSNFGLRLDGAGKADGCYIYNCLNGIRCNNLGNSVCNCTLLGSFPWGIGPYSTGTGLISSGGGTIISSNAVRQWDIGINSTGLVNIVIGNNTVDSTTTNLIVSGGGSINANNYF